MIIATMNGNLVDEPKVVNGNNGTFLSFRLAVNTFRKSTQATTYVECTYNKAELGKDLHKGTRLIVHGSLSLYTYLDGNQHAQLGASCHVYQLFF